MVQGGEKILDTFRVYGRLEGPILYLKKNKKWSLFRDTALVLEENSFSLKIEAKPRKINFFLRDGKTPKAT